MKILAKIAVIAGALFLFVFSLETIKESAAGLGPLLASMRVSGAGNLFGLGWLMAYAVLSGSPVAAVALGLFSAGTIDQIETLGMIAGSRFGAAFVVLLSGTLHYLRGRRQIITVATGVLSLLVTWTIYAPATLGAYALLRSGLFAGMRLEAAAPLGSFLDGTFSPLTGFLESLLPAPLLFVAGIALLVGSFSLFDKALPDVNPQQGRFRRIADIVYRPKVMFTLGAAVTCLTMSVSVSLGILVPISAKGYVRRENLIPYIMGANVSTFIDTIFAAILVGEPRALGVVLAQMLSVGFLSTLMLFSLFYRRYRDGLERLLEFVTQSRIHFMVFLMITMLMPFLWLLL